MSVVATIIKRELSRLLRKKGFYLNRTVFVLCVGFIFLAAYAGSNLLGITAAGARIFNRISFALLGCACIAGPFSTAPVLAQEREERTLGLLFLSEIRPSEIVLGKLFTSTFSLIATLLSGLPLLVLCIGLGGISSGQIFNGLLIIVSAGFLGTSLGLAASSIARDRKRATVAALLVGFLIYAAIPLSVTYPANSVVSGLFDKTFLLIVSPYAALNAAVAGNTVFAGLGNALFNVGLGCFSLRFAIVMLPRLAFDKESAELSDALPRFAKSPALRGNPVTWKDALAPSRSRVRKYLYGFLMAASFLGVYACGFFGALPDLPGDFGCLDLPLDSSLIVGFLSMSLFALGVTMTCADLFSVEKTSKSFELLLITGLTEEEIILGKLWAAVKSWMPWLFIAAVLIVPAGTFVIFSSSRAAAIRSDLMHMAAFVAVSSSVVFACGCMALYFSLRFRRVTATALTALICIPWLASWVLAMLNTSTPSSVGCATIITSLVFACICLGKSFHRLRQLSTGEKVW